MAFYSRELLLRVATACKGFTARNENIHGQSHVFFRSGTASATNGSSGIIMLLPELQDDELSDYSVECGRLGDLLARTTADHVEISREKDRLRLKAKPFTALLASCTSDEAPSIDLPAYQESFSPQVWAAMQKVYGFIGRDDNRPIHRGVYVADDGCVYATDNYRIACAKHNVATPSFFVHDTLLEEVIKRDAPAAYTLTESRIWFWYDGIESGDDGPAQGSHLVFNGLLFEDPPDYASVFKLWGAEQPRLAVRYHPADLKAALERILLYVNRFKQTCLVKIGPQQLELRWDEANEVHEEVLAIVVKPMTETSGVAEFYVNPQYFLDCCTKAEVFMLYGRGLRFRNEEGLDLLLGLVEHK